jgi:alpha-beta hydrolase superfamily lysophospholipase
MARNEELPIAAGRETLRGTLTLPDTTAGNDGNDTRWPAALLLASFLPRDRDGRLDRARHPGWFADPDPDDGVLARLAAALAARGVASLRYDKRGCGRSDGEWETAGAFTLVDDARDAVAALEATAAPRRIVVAGAGHDLSAAAPELFRDLAADLAARLQPRRLPTVLLSIGLR